MLGNKQESKNWKTNSCSRTLPITPGPATQQQGLFQSQRYWYVAFPVCVLIEKDEVWVIIGALFWRSLYYRSARAICTDFTSRSAQRRDLSNSCVWPFLLEQSSVEKQQVSVLVFCFGIEWSSLCDSQSFIEWSSSSGSQGLMSACEGNFACDHGYP